MNEVIEAKLMAVAANAKTLALDYAAGRLWEGDLTKRLKTIYADMSDIQAMKGEKNYD